MRMSHETHEDDGTNHDYLEDDVDIDDLSFRRQISTTVHCDADSDGGEGNAKPLHVQIIKLDVEILIT